MKVVFKVGGESRSSSSTAAPLFRQLQAAVSTTVVPVYYYSNSAKNAREKPVERSEWAGQKDHAHSFSARRNRSRGISDADDHQVLPPPGEYGISSSRSGHQESLVKQHVVLEAAFRNSAALSLIDRLGLLAPVFLFIGR